jgi:hypothetical protein
MKGSLIGEGSFGSVYLALHALGYYHAHPIVKGTAICGCDTEALKALARLARLIRDSIASSSLQPLQEESPTEPNRKSYVSFESGSDEATIMLIRSLKEPPSVAATLRLSKLWRDWRD